MNRRDFLRVTGISSLMVLLSNELNAKPSIKMVKPETLYAPYVPVMKVDKPIKIWGQKTLPKSSFAKEGKILLMVDANGKDYRYALNEPWNMNSAFPIKG